MAKDAANLTVRPASSRSSATVFDPNTHQPLVNVAVLYAQPAARDRISQAFRHIHDTLWPELGLDATWWQMDSLVKGTLTSEATASVAAADMVVIGLPPEQHLPEEVRTWISSWPTIRSSAPTSLLVSLSIDAPRDTYYNSVRPFLEQIAAKSSMDYLAFHSTGQGTPIVPLPPKPRPKAVSTFAGLEFIHGGINE